MDNILVKFENLKHKNSLKAIHLIRKAINDDSNNYEYLVALGKFLCRTEDDKEGIKYLQRAQKIAKLEPNIIFILALAYMRTDKYRQAIKQFNEVNKLYPEAFYNASISYVRLNEFEKAINEARNLVNNSNLGKEALRLIIDIYSFLGDTKMVHNELENYASKFSSDGYYNYLKGNEAYKLEHFIESAYHYSKIKKNEMERELYLGKYAFSLLEINQYHKSLEVYQEIMDTTFPQEAVVLEYAEVLYQLGKYQDVLDVIEEYDSTILNKNELKRMRAKAYYKLHLE